jgi:2'-5' RNA ligase
MKASWFVGLVVTAPSLRAALIGAPPHVRIQHADDLHATLAFLGAVDEASARAGWGALVCDLGPREVTLGAVVPLGSEKSPSALAALVHDDAITRAIADSRDAICDAAGARRETRPALAHVTLARIVKGATPAERQAAIDWASRLVLGDTKARIDRVALYTSAADREERRYRVIASRDLG